MEKMPLSMMIDVWIGHTVSRSVLSGVGRNACGTVSRQARSDVYRVRGE